VAELEGGAEGARPAPTGPAFPSPGVPPSAGTAFTALQIAQAAYDAGFRGAALVTAVAVALGESGGRPGAAGDVGLQDAKWGPSLGLWQVRSLKDQSGAGSPRDGTRLTDPLFNAQAAFEISAGGSNWKPWTVFNTGAHRQHVAAAKQAAEAVSGGQKVDYPSGPAQVEGGLDLQVGGGTSAGGLDVPAIQGAATMSDDQLRQVIRRDFGYLAWALDVPEVGDILLRMARGDVVGDRAMGEIFATEWWKTTSDAARAWDRLEGQNPGEAARQVSDRLMDVRLSVKRSGLSVDDGRVEQIARDSLRLGWRPEDIQRALVAEADFLPQVTDPSGTFGASATELRRIAEEEYLMPMSRAQAVEWSRRVLAGTDTVESFEEFVRQAAAGRFPAFASDIEAGRKPSMLFDSYRQIAANMLETDPDQIDLLNDPKFSRALEVIGKDGARRPMSLSEWQVYLRDLPEWSGTGGARDLASEATTFISRMFGNVA